MVKVKQYTFYYLVIYFYLCNIKLSFYFQICDDSFKIKELEISNVALPFTQ